MTYQTIKSYSVQRLYRDLLPFLEKTRDEYIYADINDQMMKKLMLAGLEETLNNVKESQIDKFNLYIIQNVKKQINNHIAKKLNNPKKFKNIVTNYVKLNINGKQNYEQSLNDLKKIVLFFENLNFVPTPDLYIELLEIEDVNNIVKQVVNHNMIVINSGKIYDLFDSEMLIDIIETYCMIKNIKIENANFDLENSNFDNCLDITKMYLNEIDDTLLTIDEERELGYRLLDDDFEAKKIMTEKNLKLVVSIARRYTGKGLPFLDLIQEGNLGLMKAVSKYDVRKGYKFSTYATRWIKQYISRAIANTCRNIRVPVHVYEVINKYNFVYQKLLKEFNREPSIEELAAELNMFVEEVKNIYKLRLDTISINTLIGDDEDIELENFIVVEEETKEDEMILDSLKSGVRKVFEKCNLSSREIDVLILLYGFNGDRECRQEEVGKLFGVGRERIRQIEANTLRKIRKSNYAKELAFYTDSPEDSLENLNIYRQLYKNPKNRVRRLENPRAIINNS